MERAAEGQFVPSRSRVGEFKKAERERKQEGASEVKGLMRTLVLTEQQQQCDSEIPRH